MNRHLKSFEEVHYSIDLKKKNDGGAVVNEYYTTDGPVRRVDDDL